jgi:hypothetical protein
MAEHPPTPDSLSERQMVKARMLADSLMERRRHLAEAAGKPIKSEKLSQEERKQQYMDLIASQEMLFNSIAGAAIVGRDGKLRISNKMIEAFVELSN